MEDNLDDMFVKIKTKMDLLQQMIDIFKNTTDAVIQQQLEITKRELRNEINMIASRGYNIIDLYAKLGGDVYKSEIITAQEKLKELQKKRDTQIVDLVNEDAELYRRAYMSRVRPQLYIEGQNEIQPRQRDVAIGDDNAQPPPIPPVPYELDFDAGSDGSYNFLSNRLNVSQVLNLENRGIQQQQQQQQPQLTFDQFSMQVGGIIPRARQNQIIAEESKVSPVRQLRIQRPQVEERKSTGLSPIQFNEQNEMIQLQNALEESKREIELLRQQSQSQNEADRQYQDFVNNQRQQELLQRQQLYEEQQKKLAEDNQILEQEGKQLERNIAQQVKQSLEQNDNMDTGIINDFRNLGTLIQTFKDDFAQDSIYQSIRVYYGNLKRLAGQNITQATREQLDQLANDISNSITGKPRKEQLGIILNKIEEAYTTIKEIQIQDTSRIDEQFNQMRQYLRETSEESLFPEFNHYMSQVDIVYDQTAGTLTPVLPQGIPINFRDLMTTILEYMDSFMTGPEGQLYRRELHNIMNNYQWGRDIEQQVNEEIKEQPRGRQMQRDDNQSRSKSRKKRFEDKSPSGQRQEINQKFIEEQRRSISSHDRSQFESVYHNITEGLRNWNIGHSRSKNRPQDAGQGPQINPRRALGLLEQFAQELNDHDIYESILQLGNITDSMRDAQKIQQLLDQLRQRHNQGNQ